MRDLFDITEMVDNVISNIPYNLKAEETGEDDDTKAEEIIRYLLPLVRRKMALILPIVFWGSAERYAFFDECRPIRCWAESARPSMPPGRMDGERDQFGAIIQPDSSGGTASYAVFVWERGYRGKKTEMDKLPLPTRWRKRS